MYHLELHSYLILTLYFSLYSVSSQTEAHSLRFLFLCLLYSILRNPLSCVSEPSLSVKIESAGSFFHEPQLFCPTKLRYAFVRGASASLGALAAVL